MENAEGTLDKCLGLKEWNEVGEMKGEKSQAENEEEEILAIMEEGPVINSFLPETKET